jgi:hypothetical protein
MKGSMEGLGEALQALCWGLVGVAVSCVFLILVMPASVGSFGHESLVVTD